MCGIWGILAATRCHQVHERFLVDAMQAGQVRGAHGSGMFTVTPDGYVRNQALAMSGTGFLMDKRAKTVLESTRDARIVVGHNRFTTSGQNVDAHCHPFRMEHLVGVHNGGVGNPVLSRLDPQKSHDVDSARIYAALDRVDDPLDVLKQIHSGAYCLVWYDGRKRSLLMARNHTRPLHVAETGTGLYFASELGMLGWLLGRNSHYGQGPVSIASLDPMTLYEVPLEDPSQVAATSYDAPYTALSTENWGRGPNPLSAHGNTDSHPFYEGYGLFGGVPAPVAYKRYYSEQGLLRDFPATLAYLDVLERLGTPTSPYPEVPFLLLGLGEDVLQERCAYGLVSTSTGSCQFSNMLASCRIRSEDESEFLSGLLASGAETGDVSSEWSYPIIPIQHRALLLRPTGELIVSGELPLKYGEEDIPECTWVFDIDARTTTRARELVGPECLTDVTGDQLVLAWTHLRSGEVEIVLEDIPEEEDSGGLH